MIVTSHKTIQRDLLGRAQRLVFLGLVCGGFAVSALGASVYDLGEWLAIW